MPKYYFDISFNAQIRADAEGIDLPDEKAARREAIRTIAEMAAEEIPHDGALALVIHVRDDQDHKLFRTRVTFEPDEDHKVQH